MSNPEDLYPKTKHAIIKYAALVLNKPQDHINYQDVEKFKEVISYEINNSNLSPNQIADKFSIKHTNFGMFIKNCLKIKLKDVRTAVRNTKLQMGTTITDEKSIYYKECQFKFSISDMRKILGFELVEKFGIYHPVKNPNGMVRDHILSRAEAWSQGYDPANIRHPANCQFITNTQNIKKSSSSDITYDELLARIRQWDTNNFTQPIATRRKIPRSQEHKQNLSKSIRKWHQNKIDKFGQGGRSGRPETFSKKYDWEQINRYITDGLSIKEIQIKWNITRWDLHKAMHKGLIQRQ